MNYHNIQTDDMLNGEGLRVTLFVSGCENYCDECQNPQTWAFDSGIKFDTSAVLEIIHELDHDYISGLTVSGGDPLNPRNIKTVEKLCSYVKQIYGDKKTIWIYTGYNFEDVKHNDIFRYIDVLVDGRFVKELADVKYPYAGSTNQRVIDVKTSFKVDRTVICKT